MTTDVTTVTCKYMHKHQTRGLEICKFGYGRCRDSRGEEVEGQVFRTRKRESVRFRTSDIKPLKLEEGVRSNEIEDRKAVGFTNDQSLGEGGDATDGRYLCCLPGAASTVDHISLPSFRRYC